MMMMMQIMMTVMLMIKQVNTCLIQVNTCLVQVNTCLIQVNTCLREHTLAALQCHSDRGQGRPQEIYGAVALIMVYDDI